MTREEIGSYLGLTLETVSRTFSKFQKDGLLSVHQKEISIADIGGLKSIIGRPAARSLHHQTGGLSDAPHHTSVARDFPFCIDRGMAGKALVAKRFRA